MLRLSDFGIAVALGEPRLTVHGTVVGTPGYLAPEVLAGAAPSPRQDLYAAGVTAWQLLTGEEPPERGSLPARPPDATDPIWDVVADLTRPDPTARPESAAEALAALAPSLAEPLAVPAHTPDGELIEVSTIYPHSTPPTQPPPCKTHRPRPKNPHQRKTLDARWCSSGWTDYGGCCCGECDGCWGWGCCVAGGD